MCLHERGMSFYGVFGRRRGEVGVRGRIMFVGDVTFADFIDYSHRQTMGSRLDVQQCLLLVLRSDIHVVCRVTCLGQVQHLQRIFITCQEFNSVVVAVVLEGTIQVANQNPSNLPATYAQPHYVTRSFAYNHLNLSSSTTSSSHNSKTFNPQGILKANHYHASPNALHDRKVNHIIGHGANSTQCRKRIDAVCSERVTHAEDGAREGGGEVV